MIIALTGPAGSGKDTAARYLCDAWRDLPRRDGDLWGPSTATTLALADPIRDAADALGVPADRVRSRKDEALGRLWLDWEVRNEATGRGLLLALGRAARGVLGEDYFARLGVERARDAESLCEGRLVIVTDVRREVEARLLAEAGARLLHVDRGVDPSTDALFGPEWPAIQRLRLTTLSNQGGLVELAVACRAVVEALRFETHLKRSSAVVETWPGWKRDVLGGLVVDAGGDT